VAFLRWLTPKKKPPPILIIEGAADTETHWLRYNVFVNEPDRWGKHANFMSIPGSDTYSHGILTRTLRRKVLLIRIGRRSRTDTQKKTHFWLGSGIPNS